MADALTFILAAFAVYRLATDFAWEAGPFELYARVRGWAMQSTRAEWVAEGISCPICVSFWVALLFACWLRWWPGDVVLWWLALAGVAAFLARLKG